MTATLELLAEHGLRGMSMDAVAARAGASKATIYRRWRSKEELVAALLEQIAAFVQPIDTGDARSDLVEMTRTAASGRAGIARLLPRLVAAASIDPELERLVHEKLMQPRRRQMREFVERAIEQGDIRPDVDPQLAADMMFGTLVFRMQLGEADPAALADVSAELWDTLVEGLGTDRARRRLKRARSAG